VHVCVCVMSAIAQEETIIEVNLTKKQIQYYKAILERNMSFLCKGGKAANKPSLLNVVMELRKVRTRSRVCGRADDVACVVQCCNHPFLIKNAEAQLTNNSKDPSVLVRARARARVVDRT
jgi:SNF2 family DNA or RNA helicase